MKTFILEATVNTESPAAVLPVLKRLLGKNGTVRQAAAEDAKHGGKGEFIVRATLEGEGSKELNRTLLSALRSVEKKTRLRSHWTAHGTTESYFDYVLKKTSRGGL